MSLVVCSVYKTLKRADTYLYVIREEGLKRVPSALLERMEPLQHVMDMPWRSDRDLARVRADVLHRALIEQGYFLQLPPAPDDETREFLGRIQQRDKS
ncbi:MAG: YcgL domain-containing protein [Pseudomonadales bacterium]|nr:YcgL domain-containing protein [Pseudomonadales bacterium]